MPERIQMRRIKGWRKPEGAISAARPSIWGNPWRIVDDFAVDGPGLDHVAYLTPEAARGVAVDLFREWLNRELRADVVRAIDANAWAELCHRRDRILTRLDELRGHDIGCWCPLGPDFYGDPVPCHADVLLELANG